jgi:hypothetical protein
MNKFRIRGKDLATLLRKYVYKYPEDDNTRKLGDKDIIEYWYKEVPAVRDFFEKNFTVVFDDIWTEMAEKATGILDNLGNINPITGFKNQYMKISDTTLHPVVSANQTIDKLWNDISTPNDLDRAKTILSGLDPASLPMEPFMNWWKNYFNKLDDKQQTELISAIPPTIATVILSNPEMLSFFTVGGKALQGVPKYALTKGADGVKRLVAIEGSIPKGVLAPGVAKTVAEKVGALAARAGIMGTGVAGTEFLGEIERKQIEPTELATAFGVGAASETLNSIVGTAIKSLGQFIDSDGTVQKGIVEKLSRFLAKNRTPTPDEVYDSISQLDLPIDKKMTLRDTIDMLIRRYKQGTRELTPQEVLTRISAGEAPESITATGATGMSARIATDKIRQFYDRLMDPKTSLEAIQQFKGELIDAQNVPDEMKSIGVEMMADVIRRAINTAPEASAMTLRVLLGRLLGLGLAGGLIGGSIKSFDDIKEAYKRYTETKEEAEKRLSKKGNPFKFESDDKWNEYKVRGIKNITSEVGKGAALGSGIGIGAAGLSAIQPVIQTSPLAQQLISKGIAVTNKITPDLSSFVLQNPALVEPIGASLGTRAMERMPPSVYDKKEEKKSNVEANIGKSTYSRLIDALTKTQTKKKYTIEKVEK